MEQSVLTKKLKSYFKTRSQKVEMAFLFGSQAKGKEVNQSDIDIAIFLKSPYRYEDIKNIWNELEDLLQTDLDLVVLNETSPTIAWSALRGIPLLIRNYQFYLNYMLSVSREAEDFQDFILDFWRLRENLKAKVG